MLRALAFDFNGVLVNDEPVHLACFQRVLAEERIALGTEEYYERYLGFDDRGAFEAIYRDRGRPIAPELRARLIARKSLYYLEAVQRDGFPFFAGAVELVREAAAELPLVIVSGALRSEIAGALRQEGLAPLVRKVIAAEDVASGKPDPEGYRLAIAALNSEPPLPSRLIHPHEVLAIEDSPAGVASAAEAGLRTLAVGHSYPLAELAAAEARVDSIRGVRIAGLRELFP
ncbi:MAG: HAD family hydrolase [Thermoanaerobaculia bacterium]